MRSTLPSSAAALITAKWPCVQIFGSTSFLSSATTFTADISSRSSRESAGQAAAGVEADRARFEFRGLELAGEQFPRGILRIVRIGERRQRFRIDAAFVLGECAARQGQECGGKGGGR